MRQSARHVTALNAAQNGRIAPPQNKTISEIMDTAGEARFASAFRAATVHCSAQDR